MEETLKDLYKYIDDLEYRKYILLSFNNSNNSIEVNNELKSIDSEINRVRRKIQLYKINKEI